MRAVVKRIRPLLAALLLYAAVAFAVCLASTPAYAQAQTTADPVQLINEWVSAVTAHDFDRAVSVMNEDAFLILDYGDGLTLSTYEGKAAIEDELRKLLNGARVRLLQPSDMIEGTVVWMEEWARENVAAGQMETAVRGEALVRDGAIVSLIYTDSSQGHTAFATNAVTLTSAGMPTGMPRSGAANSGFLPVWIVVLGGVALLAGSSLLLLWKARLRGRLRQV